MARPACLAVLTLFLVACAARTPDAPSGNPPPDDRALRQLAEAREAHHRAPRDEDAAIWHGRRLAYVGRYEDAVAVYTEALRLHPASYRLLRHRGHRFITLRRFKDAEADLARAAELCRDAPDAIEPDGIPNALNTPVSTDKSNIFYHLGLARFLMGDYAGALDGFSLRRTLPALNPDMLVSTTHWEYMCLRRLGRDNDAAALLVPIHPALRVVENQSYLDLCLLYKGILSPADALAGHDPDSPAGLAVAFGVAHWQLLEGDRGRARAMFAALAAHPSRAAFGVIAAEAELARLELAPSSAPSPARNPR